MNDHTTRELYHQQLAIVGSVKTFHSFIPNGVTADFIDP